MVRRLLTVVILFISFLSLAPRAFAEVSSTTTEPNPIRVDSPSARLNIGINPDDLNDGSDWSVAVGCSAPALVDFGDADGDGVRDFIFLSFTRAGDNDCRFSSSSPIEVRIGKRVPNSDGSSYSSTYGVTYYTVQGTSTSCPVVVEPREGVEGETKFTVSGSCNPAPSDSRLFIQLRKTPATPVNQFYVDLVPDPSNASIKTVTPLEFGPVYDSGDFFLYAGNGRGTQYGQSLPFKVTGNPIPVADCSPPDYDMTRHTCVDPRCTPTIDALGRPTCKLGAATVSLSPTAPTIPPFNPTHCTEGATNSGILTAFGCIQTNPGEFIGRIFGIILGLAGGIALLLIIYSGYRMMMASGNPEALQGARETMTAAIVGLLFIIFSFVILEVIGVDILRIPQFGRSVAPGCEVPETALYNKAGCGFSEGTKNLCYNLDSIPEDQLTEQQQAWRIKCFDEGYLQDNSGILQQCSDLSFAIDRPDICDPATVRMRCSLYRADEYDTYPDTVKALFDKCVANGYR